MLCCGFFVFGLMMILHHVLCFIALLKIVPGSRSENFDLPQVFYFDIRMFSFEVVIEIGQRLHTKTYLLHLLCIRQRN